MKWTIVKSSNLQAISHDERTERLVVKFKHGGAYAYDGVPKTVVEELLAAPSVGKAFYARIRRRFPSQKIEIDE